MPELQQKIDNILSERKSRIDKISAQSDLIDSLYPNLQKIQKTISELGVEGAAEKEETISNFLGNLNQAREKLRLLKKRYEKSTINIGVSGFTHAGKSTLLQAISGLGDDAIPKADEDGEDSLHPTTAICSQIFNSPDTYAEIGYKTDSEYLEFVNAHLKIAGLSMVSSVSEFQDTKIPKNNDNEETINTIKDRLRLIQESIPYYKGQIGNVTKKISGDEFDRLKYYLTYSPKNKSIRFFPAVKEVKIYCKFPALNNPNIKLCLVDLPGFGEFENVDEIQTKNLREIVDHIIFIYKTNKDEGIGNKKYLDSFKTIREIHISQSTNNDFLLNFINFFINEDHDNAAWQNHVNQTIETIKQRYGNYKYYSFPAWLGGVPNEEVAMKNFNEIVSHLADTLPKVDEILLKSLSQSLDLSELNIMLEKLSKFVDKYSYANDDPTKFHGKGRLFRENFHKDIERLLSKYQGNSEEIDNDFCSKVLAISNQTDNDIAKDLLYKSTPDRPTWEIYIEHLPGGAIPSFAPELRRV